MLGNQELQGEPQDKLSSHLEPDQEVAAVLGAGTLYYNVKYRYSHHVPTDNEHKLEEIAICCGFKANICHSYLYFFSNSTDPNFAQAASASVKRNSRCSSSKEIPPAALKVGLAPPRSTLNLYILHDMLNEIIFDTFKAVLTYSFKPMIIL